MTGGAAVPVTVIGAGPYGLAVAAHLKARNLPVRVLGAPMDGWRSCMPVGMFLKSTPSASSISDPHARFRLADFRAATGRENHGDLYPVSIAEFIDYGSWFQQNCVPEVEQLVVLRVEGTREGFRLTLDSGETFTSRAVVLATGLRPYARTPRLLEPLVRESLASHTVDHRDLSVFAGRRVAVIGAGQSALESAALLHEAGAEPTVLVRADRVRFGSPPTTDVDRDRPVSDRLVKPGSPLGPGWSLFAFSRAPGAFRHLPDRSRVHFVRTVLGPSGAWWLRPRVDGKFPVLTGHSVEQAERKGDGVLLRLRGATRELEVDHVLAATGYQVDVARLDLLDPAVERALRRTPAGSPRLSATFESSVPGLYFAGLSAADTFGPVMRFVAGTGFAAGRISGAVAGGRH
ncbi:hypothetical protein GCM10010441_76700 [Kitasatospora paracochleata]|uniref:Cation diffusion facilitator CzcD-associated flavoprotein CzcO n=1 Tax=Kitasatospora paracochleata TaxID=58354 RepID=A0ABT1IU03_9ACTN|nr:NAD(P)-binding domain-containing protein [Kitasatospora paracochleata]MCP2308620.1 cation diffusion facilitator CzcD-associated flavoprotein CzcO [Kitasatospora paracochleata]